MKKIRHFLSIVSVTALLLFVTNCEKLGGTGVCTGYSAEYNSTYCKDGWTQAECDDWNDQQINGVSWTFHRGQTCDERGTPATP